MESLSLSEKSGGHSQIFQVEDFWEIKERIIDEYKLIRHDFIQVIGVLKSTFPRSVASPSDLHCWEANLGQVEKQIVHLLDDQVRRLEQAPPILSTSPTSLAPFQHCLENIFKYFFQKVLPSAQAQMKEDTSWLQARLGKFLTGKDHPEFYQAFCHLRDFWSQSRFAQLTELFPTLSYMCEALNQNDDSTQKC